MLNTPCRNDSTRVRLQMTEEDKQCGECGKETYHRHIGFVPIEMVAEGAGKDQWVNADFCTACGNISIIPTSEEELEQVEENYVNMLVDENIIDRYEAEEILAPQDSRLTDY